MRSLTGTRLIAFTGARRSGKDTAALPLIEAGWLRRCFGDIIKRQADGVVLKLLGFSAFTEVPAEKEAIRPLLEQWGEVFHAAVMREFFESLPERCVNTRLMRVSEGQEWVKRGGVIVEVRRPGHLASTDFEVAALNELRAAGLVSDVVYNAGTPFELYQVIRHKFIG